jgi:hypothetical protein
MELSREEKLHLMGNLNWDYAVSPEDMLAVIEGALVLTGPFDRGFLFLRSLERLPWHYLIALWGVKPAMELYTPEIARRLWPKVLRSKYDFAFGVLRKEPVSPAEWGSPRARQLQNTVFSHRWYRT